MKLTATVAADKGVAAHASVTRMEKDVSFIDLISGGFTGNAVTHRFLTHFFSGKVRPSEVEHDPADAEHDPANAFGRPTGFDIRVGGAEVSTQIYSYDPHSRLPTVASSHLSAGLSHLIGTDTVQGVTITLGGNVIHTRTLAVDLLGRTVGVVNKAGPNAGSLATVASIGHVYDTAGRRGNARREDGTRWDYSYNDRSEVTSAIKRTTTNELVPRLSFGYDYDGMGNRLTSSIGTEGGVVSTRTYTPDAFNQYDAITHDGKVHVLTGSDAAVTATATNATHDGVNQEGNLYGVRQTATPGTTGKLVTTNLFRSGTAAGSVQTWVPPANLVPTHDLDGNLTWDGRWNYTWDGENRLVSMTTAANAITGGAPNVTLKFAYDWMGRRIGKTTVQSGTTTHLSFAYDHWNLVAEWKRTALTGSLTGTALQLTHLWGPDIASTAKAGFGTPPSFQAAGGVSGLLASTFHTGATKDHFIPSYDANGNILAWSQGSTTPVQRMDYDPFGNAVMVEKFGTGTLVDKLPAFGFSSKYEDKETGLYYYGYRFYDPLTGRWPSRDPIAENGGVNLHGFIGNSTLSSFDYLGLEIVCCEIDGYLEENGVSVYSRVKTPDQKYRYGRSAKAGAGLKSEILQRMIGSRRIFFIEDNTLENLEKHVKSRIEIVAAAKRLAEDLKFATVGPRYNKKIFEVVDGNLKVRRGLTRKMDGKI